jgi:Tol biopolymer transport system component
MRRNQQDNSAAYTWQDSWRDRRWSSVSLATALLLLGLHAIVARAEPAEGGADDKKPEGLIYASIFRAAGTSFAREIVEIDPQTGKCEAIADNGHGPRLSPDGHTLAFWTIAGNNEGREVWVKELRGADEAIRIWSGAGIGVTQAWTQDGTHLVVSQGIHSGEPKKWQFNTWLVDPASSEASELRTPATDNVVDHSPTSDLVLVSNVRNQLFMMLADGTRATALVTTEGRIYHGRFSPDGKRVAYLQHQRGEDRVCSVDADGKNVRVAFTEKDPTAPSEVCWSPDSKPLAIVLFDWSRNAQGQKTRFAGGDAHYRIVLMDPDGANPRELTLDRAVLEIGAPEWR